MSSEAWTRAEALAFVARWHFLGKPRRGPSKALTFDSIRITIGGHVFPEETLVLLTRSAIRDRLRRARRTA